MHTYVLWVSGITNSKASYQAPHLRSLVPIDLLNSKVLSSIKDLYQLPSRVGPEYHQTPWQCYGGHLRSVHHSYDTSAASVIHNNLAKQFPKIARSSSKALARE